MSDFDLPEFVDRELLVDVADVEVPDEAILGCFTRANKPYLSTAAVADMTSLSSEGARQRLNSLVDRGVLFSDDAGKQTKIYWLNHPQSSWPVPDDLPSSSGGPLVETVVKINRVTTFVTFFGGLFAIFYALDWASDLSVTDGVFEITLVWGLTEPLFFGLLAVVFYIALQTSLHVENDDAGWPTIRRVYRRITGAVERAGD